MCVVCGVCLVFADNLCLVGLNGNTSTTCICVMYSCFDTQVSYGAEEPYQSHKFGLADSCRGPSTNATYLLRAHLEVKQAKTDEEPSLAGPRLFLSGFATVGCWSNLNH